MFRPLTHEGLAAAEARIAEELKRTRVNEKSTLFSRCFGPEGISPEGEEPDSLLENGMPLPKPMAKACPKEVIGVPVEDVDKFYENQKTFIVIGNKKNIFRFSCTKAFWVLDPFNPIRRTAIRILVHPIFSFIIMTTIIINFFLMTLPSNQIIASIEIAFIIIYTVEFIIKAVSRGFLLAKFAYLREPWNWLDFAVVCSGYVSMIIYMGNISALRMFQIIRAIKYCSGCSGIRTTVRAVLESLKNLRELVVFTLFSLSMCSLVGMQLYMGALHEGCTSNMSSDVDSDGLELSTEVNKDKHGCQDGSGECSANTQCDQGADINPDYGYTNFDTFLWAMLASFRLMTQDFWEDLHRRIVTSSGMWNTVVVAVIIWGFFCVINFILAVVLMSYEWQRRFVQREAKVTVLGKQAQPEENSAPTENANDLENQQKPDVQINTYIDDQEDFSQRCSSQFSRFVDTFCVWNCCRPWVSIKELCSKIIFHPVSQVIIAILIICNAILLSLYHHNMTYTLEHAIYYGSFFFVIVFTVEICLKIIAMDPKNFFHDSWNQMDFFIIVLSVAEIILSGMSTISVCRVLVLLKMVKNCKSWPTAQLVVTIIDKSWSPVMNLSIIFVLIIAVFAAVGMNLFGSNYFEHKHMFYEEEIPRWHFGDYLHGFMLVFRVACGEWIESMWDCMLVSGYITVMYFMIVVVVCRFVVANLYRAVILTEVNDIYLSELPEETDASSNDNDIAFRRVSWGIGSPQSKLCSPLMENENATNHAGNELGEYVTATAKESNDPEEINGTSNDLHDKKKLNSDADEDMDKFNISCGFHSGGCRWNKLRRSCYILSEKKYYEVLVTGITIAFTICLACEDAYIEDRPVFAFILEILNIVFTLLFALEMFIRLMALGCKGYFKNFWCCIDFIIVLACTFSLFTYFLDTQNMMSMTGRTLRSFRGLVPLKIISHINGLKVVMIALGHSLPGMLTLSLFGCLFWLIFAVIGVKLFNGKFNYCVGQEGDKLNTSHVPNKEICFVSNYTWVSPEMNFDNVLSAYLALFQVATFKGWIGIMHDAVDTRDNDFEQPEEEGNIYMYYFFVVFAIVGSFFTLNLYLGVLIYSFNKQKKKAGSYVEVLMTEGQQRFCNAVRKLSIKPPVRAASRPRLKIQAALYDLTMNQKFELVLKLLVGAYFMLLILEHSGMIESFETVLELLSSVLVAVFVLECAIKIFALRGNYFKEGWNFFDFIVVALALIGVILKNVIAKYFMSSVLTKVAGVLKIGLVIRLAKGVRAMIVPSFAFILSLPALFNICLLHFIFMCVYAIFGMAFFMNVKHRHYVDENFNFETFCQSMILLFEISSLAGWDSLVLVIMEEDDCFADDHEEGIVGNCGHKGMAIAFVVSFAAISLLITINLFIAVILDSYRCVRKDIKKEVKNGK